MSVHPQHSDADVALFGNRFVTQEVPTREFPETGIPAQDALRLVSEDLAKGDPARNLATFVTTWMEPQAQQIIAANLHRNFIDHAEYPRTAEIEQRCIRMLADLFHAPGETTGARTQGSSEAIMLGGLSLKWNWRKRREAAGASTSRPNLVFGGDVHVVWEKFCRYFDVEPRIVPLQPGKYTIGPEDVGAPCRREHHRCRRGSRHHVHRPQDVDVAGINDLLLRIKSERGLDVPLHVDGASGGFVWPFLYPDSEWDFRLEQVRSINVSGHKFGLVYPGIGWLIFREEADLAKDLVFEENYLGKTDSTFTLNFSTGSAMVSRPVLQLVHWSRRIHLHHAEHADQRPGARRQVGGHGPVRDHRPKEEQLPLVAFRLAEDNGYDEFDIAWQLSAERGWMVPAYTLPPNAQNETIMRALVKETMSREHVDTLARDIEEACSTLAKKGGAHESERNKIVTGPGH